MYICVYIHAPMQEFCPEELIWILCILSYIKKYQGMKANMEVVFTESSQPNLNDVSPL